uniref:Uncharacterized protein n=1 Tax=Onchocerca volvulus TaxID=6282 RepID=A0A8R1XME7_ONCVO
MSTNDRNFKVLRISFFYDLSNDAKLTINSIDFMMSLYNTIIFMVLHFELNNFTNYQIEKQLKHPNNEV